MKKIGYDTDNNVLTVSMVYTVKFARAVRSRVVADAGFSTLTSSDAVKYNLYFIGK